MTARAHRARREHGSPLQGANAEPNDPGVLVTGSRLPHKDRLGTQPTRAVSPEEWQRYQPPSGFKAE